MNLVEIIMLFAILTAGAVLICLAKGARSGFKKLLLNAFLGLALLYLGANFVKTTLISFEINLFSIAFSMLFGMPGAIFTAIVQSLQNL